MAARLDEGMTAGDAIAAVFEAYAAERGKPRWGDKTPLYMQYLPLLERLFPTALYVHLIRDGRDAALSYLAVPEGIMTAGWGHPRDAAGFACQWATEVARRACPRREGRPARYLEVRYEALVADPDAELRRVCGFAVLPYDDAMLGYVGQTDSARKQHQQRLNEPPRVGVRDWRTEMPPSEVAGFEAVAGDLLHELGYGVSRRGARPPAADRIRGEDPRVARRRGGDPALAALAPPPPDPPGTRCLTPSDGHAPGRVRMERPVVHSEPGQLASQQALRLWASRRRVGTFRA